MKKRHFNETITRRVMKRIFIFRLRVILSEAKNLSWHRLINILLLLTALCTLLPVFSFAQMEWICATNSAEWSPRDFHASVVFDNKIWVLGGHSTSSRFWNDVWYSTDGVSWACATDSAGWSRRSGHTAVVFDAKIWVLGGSDNLRLRNDVWYSSDGVNWTCADDSANWSERCFHASVVFDNKMWVLGGNDRSDIWWSADGVNWTLATDSAGWSRRVWHKSVVFDDKIWILGGLYFKDDVWYSTDGVNWICATDSAGWLGREALTSVAFDNKIWVLGGLSNYGFKNDVWYSIDGINWTCATDSAGWLERWAHTSVVFNNKIWVLGGRFRNDVWYSSGLGIVEERTTLDATRKTPEIYPNPAKSVVRVRVPWANLTPNASRPTLKIFDVSGKLIKEAASVSSRNDGIRETKISLKGINPGIYFLQLGTEVKKFLVVK
jgi:hypothetical protein